MGCRQKNRWFKRAEGAVYFYRTIWRKNMFEVMYVALEGAWLLLPSEPNTCEYNIIDGVPVPHHVPTVV